MSKQRSTLAVTYQPPAVQQPLPAEVEDYLLSLPAVSGFRLADDPKKKCVVVMVATRTAAAALPKRLVGYDLEPEVTGAFRAY